MNEPYFDVGDKKIVILEIFKHKCKNCNTRTHPSYDISFLPNATSS